MIPFPLLAGVAIAGALVALQLAPAQAGALTQAQTSTQAQALTQSQVSTQSQASTQSQVSGQSQASGQSSAQGKTQQASGTVLCDTGLYEIRANFDGARANACRVMAPRGVVLTIEPEDAPPINPSPWYGFHVHPRQSDEQGSIVVTLRYPESRHRYWPKTSADGVLWERLGERHWLAHEDGRATMELKPGPEGLYVSAQENLGLAFYEDWRRSMADRFDGVAWQKVGNSENNRPIFAAITAPDAPSYLLLIGRQHPPEVPGALMFAAFAEALLEARARSCANTVAHTAAHTDARTEASTEARTSEARTVAHADSTTCAFFEQHSLVLVPNLNPDGVAGGHWRHNAGGADLNRDWGRFEQSETRTVRELVNQLEQNGKSIALMLDFHATWRNVFYVPTLEDATEPPAFTSRWLQLARANKASYEFEEAPRSSEETAIAKNYFYRRFGIPAITVETGDDADRDEIAATAGVLADSLVTVLGGGEGPLARRRGAICPDFFCYLMQANKASLVMLAEQGLIDSRQAREIAGAMVRLNTEQSVAGARRAGNYLPFEKRLIELVGEGASNLHLGRSRQDLHGVVRRMLIRDQWLQLFDSALRARAALLDLADKEADTPIPAYTHGVQAQPTTLGHFLLAFSANLGRDGQRYREGYARMNRSPLGAAALGTSGFPVDRDRLAELLGFAAPVDNSYDANLLSSGDLLRELAGILALSAIPIGQLVENLHTQYHNPRPWILIDESATSISTIMPQKRNPRPLDRVRSQASQVLGSAQTQMLLAHNLNTGMHDYRGIGPITGLAGQAQLMYRRYTALIGLLRVDRERALDELRRGYSTMTEVADVLAREAGLPFRAAHRYASALTDYARANARLAGELTDEELTETYREVMGERLPLAPERLRQALDPVSLLKARQGQGGPQPEELQRMLREHLTSLEADRQWLARINEELLNAWLELHTAFAALATSGS